MFQPDASKSRIEKRRSVIILRDGELTLGRDKETHVSQHGATTQETQYSVMVNGERISSHRQIVGQCTMCPNPVTHFSIRRCFCGRVLCVGCSEWLADEGRPVCKDCLKALKREKFWRTLKAILISPFVERTES